MKVFTVLDIYNLKSPRLVINEDLPIKKYFSMMENMKYKL